MRSVGLVDLLSVVSVSWALFAYCRSHEPFVRSVGLVSRITPGLILLDVELVGFIYSVSNSWAV